LIFIGYLSNKQPKILSVTFFGYVSAKKVTKETPKESFARARAIQGSALKTRKVFKNLDKTYYCYICAYQI
jgi:hypothetical protein